MGKKKEEPKCRCDKCATIGVESTGTWKNTGLGEIRITYIWICGECETKEDSDNVEVD